MRTELRGAGGGVLAKSLSWRLDPRTNLDVLAESLINLSGLNSLTC